MKNYHIVRTKDRERIKCGLCGDNAYICQHAHWDIGHTKGVSFWYYCKEHSPLAKVQKRYDMIDPVEKEVQE